MITTEGWRVTADDLIASGKLAQAAIFLQRRLSSSSCSDQSRVAIAAELTDLFIRQSRFREAYDAAMLIKSARKIEFYNNSFVFVLCTRLLLASYIFGIEGIFCWFMRPLLRATKGASWPEINALLWGTYWQNIDEALRYNLVCCLIADDDSKKNRSYAFLAYTMAIKGHGVIGLRVLKMAIKFAEKAGDVGARRDLMVWLGVAYQWSAHQKESIAIHDQFDKEYPEADPFLKIITYASRLHTSFTDHGPKKTKDAIDVAFNMSLALKESRNHIQIFGAKSALLALEGRFNESDIYLEKASKATDRNDNNLDRIIFHSMAIVVSYYKGDLNEALRHLSIGESYLAAYGAPARLKQELHWLRAIVVLGSKNSVTSRLYQSLKIFFGSLNFLSLERTIRASRWSIRMLTERDVGYWASSSSCSYLRGQILDDGRLARQTGLERLTLSLTEALLDPSSNYGEEEPVIAKLVEKVSRAFPKAVVVHSSSTDACLMELPLEVKLAGGVIFNDISDILSVPCTKDRFFVAVAIAPSSGVTDLAIGVLMDEMESTSPSIVEAGVRILLAEYANALAYWKTRVDEIRNQKNDAIARMTQMLAHDVRKPFSILRMGLGMLSNARDPDSVKSILKRLVPEIDKAVGSVDGLIADVMEVGSTATELIQEAASPEALIEATLGEAFRIYPKADIAIQYDLQHTHMANVNIQKVGRVFSNIVGNAMQAMRQNGVIWFKTREHEGQIEFCVGNAGSCIPPEFLPRLFDAFFTSGKKGGTGLGLAIAEKVVTAHGGKIWCESGKTPEYPAGQVEFFFTLPVVDGRLSKTTAILPGHSSDITKALTLVVVDQSSSEGSVDKGELTLEADIIQLSSELRRPLKVLVVDDEAVYRNALVSYFTRTPELAEAISVQQSTGSTAALAAAMENSLDLIITDVDMGIESMDGFELVRALRQNGATAMICVHSNRIVAADHKTAITSGADAFVPKPVARAQLLRLMLQAGKVRQHLEGQMAPDRNTPDLLLVKPEILVVDDNPFILEAWAEMLQGEASLHLISSLEDLSARLEDDPGFADRLLLAVTDMHLGGSAGDGLDVGRLLKRYRPELLVLLSSDGVFGAEELHGTIDTTIGKDPVELSKLLAFGARA